MPGSLEMNPEGPRAREEGRARRSAGLLTVDLGEPLKAAWQARCQSEGVHLGPAVVALVTAALAAPPAPCTVCRPLETGRGRLGVRPDVGKRCERRLVFTPSEDRAIGKAAQDAGMGYQQWVVAAVRGALARVPAFGQAELEALVASNLALAQLTMELSAWRRSGLRPDTVLDRLGALDARVRAHVEVASATLAHGTRRWEILL